MECNSLSKENNKISKWIKDLDSEDSYVRYFAVMQLGRIDDERAIAPLIQTLKDKDEEIRKNIVEILSRMRDKSIDPLIQALLDKSSKLRTRHRMYIDTSTIDGVRTPITQTYEAKSSWARVGAAYALGEIGDKRAIEPLIQTLKDEDSKIRSSVAEALGKIDDERVVEPLIQLLKDEAWAVRRKAAEALGEIGDKRSIAPLTHALEDENKWVREAARNALERINNR